MSKIDQTEALLQVTKPSRYLGGELGSICKMDNGIEVRMALAFPDVYEVGMSHIGFRTIKRAIPGRDG